MGRPVGFVLTPGNAHEPHSLPALLDGVPASERIADRAYDAKATLVMLAARNIAAVIPSRANGPAPRWYDRPWDVRDASFCGEPVCGHLLKEFRGLATRYGQRASRYGGLLNLASALVAFREAVSLRPAGGRPAVNRRLAR